jgi:hypothetical protein
VLYIKLYVRKPRDRIGTQLIVIAAVESKAASPSAL